MSAEQYLDGALRVTRLPRNAGADRRFFGGDKRGVVAMIASGEQFQHVEYAEFAKAGVVRACHSHTSYVERLCVVAGQILLRAAKVSNGRAESEPVQIELAAGMCVDVSPFVGHALISRSPSLVISLGKGPSPFDDRVPYDPGPDFAI